MSISDLFDSEFKQRNKGQFSAIVRVAVADGKVAPEEKSFLDRLARNLDISELEYEEILENPLIFATISSLLFCRNLFIRSFFRGFFTFIGNFYTKFSVSNYYYTVNLSVP